SMPQLPADIIRKIIAYRPDCIKQFKLTSKLFYNLVREYLEDRRNMPALHKLKFKKMAGGGITITFEVQSIYIHFYPRLQARNPKYVEKMNGVNKTYKLYFSVLTSDEKMFNDLRMSTSLNVNHVEFVRMGDSEGTARNIARNLLKDVDVPRFTYKYLKFKQKESERIVADIGTYGVSKLEIHVKNVELSDPHSFLMFLTGLVDAIGIHQHANFKSNYFFGMRNVVFDTLIRKMFNRQASKIRIICPFYPAYPTARSVASLARTSACLSLSHDLSQPHL
ncbi:hypothetical protein PFISCL1PPCAC_17934, partial [Pristionchus fissidentatus]